MPSTASAARIAANKANGLKSTGPRTLEGKARVSENALKHGLRSARNPLDLAKDTALPFEQTDFLTTLTAFMAEFAPATPFETLLVERLAQIDLRLNRAVRMETAHMEYHAETVWKNIGELLPADPRSRDNQLLMLTFDRAAATIKLIHQYESRLSRDFARTLTQLRQAHNSRKQTQLQGLATDGQVADPVSTGPASAACQENSRIQTQSTELEPDQPSAADDRGAHTPNTNDTPKRAPSNSMEKVDEQTQPSSHPLETIHRSRQCAPTAAAGAQFRSTPE